MREAMRGWAMSGGHIEAPELAHVRPYLIVYRRSPAGWITVEFGEESFYVKWFGWATARSSIGRSVGNLPGGAEFARVIRRHLMRKEMYPDQPPATGMPYEGIENLRPETIALREQFFFAQKLAK